MTHEMLRELAAGAALDDLDQDERTALEAHLATCAGCRTLAAELDDLLGDLALVAPELTPPRSLEAGVLAAIRGSDGVATPTFQATPTVMSIAGPVTRLDAPSAPTRRPRATLWAAVGLAAVLGVVAVGLGVRTAQLSGEVAEVQTQLLAARSQVAAREAVMAVVADPEHAQAELHGEAVAPGATALVVWQPGSTEAYLMAEGLPATPTGQVYQLWVADEAGVHPLGTFHHDGAGPFIASFDVDLAGSSAAMVTLEPEGGAVGEPGPEVVFGEL
jgi:hypothetical protein